MNEWEVKSNNQIIIINEGEREIDGCNSRKAGLLLGASKSSHLMYVMTHPASTFPTLQIHSTFSFSSFPPSLNSKSFLHRVIFNSIHLLLLFLFYFSFFYYYHHQFIIIIIISSSITQRCRPSTLFKRQQ